MKRLLIFVCLISLCGLASAQGFSLTKPNGVGGNLVAMTQDKSSYETGTPIEEGMIIGPGIDFFLKYDVSPKFFFTFNAGVNTVNHSSACLQD